MPKIPKSVVSKEMRDSLAKLHTQIEAAEALLKKMPAARDSNVVSVKIETIFDHNGQPLGQVCLEYSSDGLVVVDYPLGGMEYDTEVESKRIADLPTLNRIEAASHIPELIALAKKAEGTVKKQADDVAASIEQAIAESMEG